MAADIKRGGARGSGNARNNSQQREPRVLCMVSAELRQQEVTALEEHFAAWPSIHVRVESRRRERRRSDDRRSETSAIPASAERRRINNRRGRRVAERRHPVRELPVAPPLPSRLISDASAVSFLLRREPDPRAAESAAVFRLVLRFQAGEEAAFHDIYERFFDRLYAYLCTALRDRHEAEDATQEVFIRALRGLPRFEVRSTPFEAWLFRIARNYAINSKERAAPVAPQDPVELERWREAAGGAEAVGWMSDADLLGLISRMPLPQRQVIVLRYMIGFEWEMIAAIMDRSSGAVRQLEQRALGSLRSRFEGMGLDQESGRLRLAMRRRSRPSPVGLRRRLALAPGHLLARRPSSTAPAGLGWLAPAAPGGLRRGC